MKPQEVIKTLELAKAEVEWEYTLEYAIAIDEAIKAMEMQIFFNTDKLKSKLKDLKHAVDHCENWDYANGFICALSNVEGIIAEMESEVEE